MQAVWLKAVRMKFTLIMQNSVTTKKTFLEF
jgi:hypothetical protein